MQRRAGALRAPPAGRIKAHCRSFGHLRQYAAAYYFFPSIAAFMLSQNAKGGQNSMKAMKQHTAGAGGAAVPFLTIVRMDYSEPGVVHFIATDGGSLYEVLVIVPEGAKIDISPNKIGFNELTGATVKVTGYETDKLDGVYISGHGIRVIYSHEYTNRTFAEAETDMLLNAGEIAG